MSESKTKSRQFVICVRNDEYLASLELRKIYVSVIDPEASDHNQLRVIDESGEDYLYPSSYFVPIELPEEAEAAVIKAA